MDSVHEFDDMLEKLQNIHRYIITTTTNKRYTTWASCKEAAQRKAERHGLQVQTVELDLTV